MHPILCKIGPFAIYSYGTMLAVAFVISVLLISLKAREQGLEKENIISLSFYVIIPAIIGARLLYVLLNLKEFFAVPYEILMIHHGGLVFYGGLLGGLLGGLFYIKKKKLPAAQILDISAPYLVLGQAIARIGCLLNGCCYGKPISSGMGLFFAPDSVAGSQEILYPTQFYSSVANLGIFLVLLKWSNFKNLSPRATEPWYAPVSGEIFAGYLMLYSLKRFLIEFLRGDTPVLLFGLTFFQLISIGLGASALTWVLITGKRR